MAKGQRSPASLLKGVLYDEEGQGRAREELLKGETGLISNKE